MVEKIAAGKLEKLDVPEEVAASFGMETLMQIDQPKEKKSLASVLKEGADNEHEMQLEIQKAQAAFARFALDTTEEVQAPTNIVPSTLQEYNAAGSAI